MEQLILCCIERLSYAARAFPRMESAILALRHCGSIQQFLKVWISPNCLDCEACCALLGFSLVRFHFTCEACCLILTTKRADADSGLDATWHLLGVVDNVPLLRF